MAREDYTGAPTEAPSLQAPDDLQRVESSPAAFGGQFADAAKQAGADFTKTADFYGEVAADQATNNFLDARDKLMYGDPNKTVMGPDGTPAPDTGFLGLRGAAAMAARPEVAAALDDAIKEQQEGLQTPMSRQAFENQSRKYRAQTLEQVGEHADREQRTWAQSTNQTSADIATNQAARSPLDPAVVAQSQQQIRQAYVRNAGINGTDARGALLKADQDLALARIRALVGSDDPAQRAQAQTVLDQNAGVLGSLPNYDSIVSSVRGAVVSATLDPTVDNLVAAAQSGASTPGAVPTMAGAGGTHIIAPTGPVYDQVSQIAAQHGATPTEITALRVMTHLESGGDPNAVSPSGRYAGILQYPKDGGPQGVEAQAVQGLTDMRRNEQTLQAAGITPRLTDLYLMHQQGPAGGKALLTAPPDMNAIAALTPAYETGGRSAAQATELATEAITHNGGTADMTAGQFVDHWRQRVGGGAVDGTTAGMSTADRLRTQMPDLVANARATLEKQFPNQPDVVDRGMDRFERQLNLTITQQDQRYLVDTHAVQSAMDQAKPISIEELRGTNPDAAAAYDRLTTENPLAQAGIDRMFAANAHGAALGYGTGFKDMLDRALAPSTDPNRIKDPNALYPFVGAGESAVLTNTGVSQISGLLGLRGTPQGEAQAAQIKTFVDQAHGQLTFSNPVTGVYDEKGEARYNKFIAQALPILEKSAKAGSLSAVLNPNSPDFIGKTMAPFMRSQTEMLDDQVNHASQGPVSTTAYTVDSLTADMSRLDNDQQRRDALQAAVKTGRLTAPIYQAWLDARAGRAGAAPAGPLRAPTPAAAPSTGLTDAQARERLRAEGIANPDVQ